MARQKTLFKKYLRITMAIVLVSFIALGSMLIAFVSGYWQDEKYGLLEENARNISELFSKSGIVINDSIYLTGSKLKLMQGVIDSFSSNINGEIFITDNTGKTIICSSNYKGEYFKNNVSEDIMKKAMEGNYAVTSTLGGIYSSNYYTVASPIYVDMGYGSKVIGVVFASVDAGYITSFQSEVVKIFLFASLIALAISFCAVWVMSYKMVLPLRQMSSAAKSFGDGDFSQRVAYNSQDEVGQLAIAFNNMAQSLSESENIRRSFIANVSHELKTPMTTIAGFIDGILDGTIPPEKQEHYLTIVSNEIKRLSRLVRSMLDLSRIDSGELKLNKQKFDITSTVLAALISFESSISAKNISISGLENVRSIYVNGDQDMIHQVAYNLIDNAVKFTNQDGHISIRIFERGNSAVVTIRNTGEGIAPADINLVFDRFYKTDKSRSQDKNGMGLGLYIVKTIVKLHEGDIKATSVQGQYCEFEFWIPIDDTNNINLK